MHKSLKHSMMYSLATMKTHIHGYLKHIYHSMRRLCGSPTYPYITHATTCVVVAISHQLPCWESILDDLDSDGFFSMY